MSSVKNGRITIWSVNILNPYLNRSDEGPWQMYISAAHLVSIYSGMSYIDFVKQRIFAPLGMSSTTFSPSEAATKFGLTQSWNAQKRRIPIWFGDDMMDMNAGAGGILSTAKDMVRILLPS